MGRETWQFEQAARLRGPDRLLESLRAACRSQIIFVDADHPRHSPSCTAVAVFARLDASHAARCVACHGVHSHPVPVALVGECSHLRR